MNSETIEQKNKPQFVVGLTGGIASGKSAVSSYFASQGVPIIDADKIARDLFRQGAPLLKQLKNRFGKDIFNQSNELDRKKLGAIVFNSPADLKWLNQLTHPQVRQEILSQLKRLTGQYVVIDIPLLVDKNGDVPEYLGRILDRILVVNTSPEQQLKRLCERDKIDQQHAKAIIANQSSLTQKLKHADDIVDNNGTLDQLESQVALLHNQYIHLSQARKRSD